MEPKLFELNFQLLADFLLLLIAISALLIPVMALIYLIKYLKNKT